jgi:hypothetical protein
MRDDCIVIPLTQGKETIIDAADADLVLPHKWLAFRSRGMWYAARNVGPLRAQHTVMLHRVLLDPPPGMVPDHIDGDGLNNRRSNLRLATISQNVANRTRHPLNTSGYVGVSWFKKAGAWRADIKVNRKQRYLGCFATAEEAARVRDAAAREAFGEYAYLNFPD